MKNFVLLILLSSACLVDAQSLRPGISFTYLYDYESGFIDAGQHQFTVNANLAFEVTPRVNIGIQYLDIRTHGSAYTFSNEKQNYYIAGLYFQLDVVPEWRAEIFPELSINYGNFCPCGRTDPFEQPGIVYVGYGLGMDYPLNERVFIDLGLHYYRPLTNIKSYNQVYSYGGYVLGFSYRLL